VHIDCLVANEDAPGVIVPTLVGRAKYKSGIVDMGQESIRSGHGAYAGRGILHLRRPMKVSKSGSLSFSLKASFRME